MEVASDEPEARIANESDVADPADPVEAGPHADDVPTDDDEAATAGNGEDQSTAIAAFRNVTVSYGETPALGPLDLTIEGSCVGLLGPNGAGKTTMMRAMMGLLTPQSGTVSVLGRSATDAAAQRRIGYAPEGQAAFPDMNGVQSVAYAGQLVGMPAADALQRAHQVLDYVGLHESRYRRASSYSTGMRQRLKLAQALVHDPEILILDEPTEGVDPGARDDILGLISELSTEYGIRVLISTHLMADVERLASHAVILSQGQVMAHGSLDELKTAGATGHIVRVNGDTKAFTDHLDSNQVSWKSLAPSLHVELDDAADVLRHILAAGLEVRHIAPAQMRLDEAVEHALDTTEVQHA